MKCLDNDARASVRMPAFRLFGWASLSLCCSGVRSTTPLLACYRLARETSVFAPLTSLDLRHVGLQTDRQGAEEKKRDVPDAVYKVEGVSVLVRLESRNINYHIVLSAM